MSNRFTIDPDVLQARLKLLDRGAHEGSWTPTGMWLIASLLVRQTELLEDLLDVQEEQESLLRGLNERFVTPEEDDKNGGR